MTARRELRIGGRRLGRGQAPIDATPAPPVGETLQLARERKGVDLYRAERDTKIRLRYLSALEDSAYDDLPPPVYTKGFLRNYAIYLGLDPDELLERWRDEMEQIALRASGSRSRRRRSRSQPGAPGDDHARACSWPAWLRSSCSRSSATSAIQLLRFAEVTPVSLTQPPNVFSTIDAETTVLEGHERAGRGDHDPRPGRRALQHDRRRGRASGREQVNLARGRNDFSISALDRVTGRESPVLLVTIVRPLPDQTAAPSLGAHAPAPVPALTMTLVGPTDGAISTDGNVLVLRHNHAAAASRWRADTSGHQERMRHRRRELRRFRAHRQPSCRVLADRGAIGLAGTDRPRARPHRLEHRLVQRGDDLPAGQLGARRSPRSAWVSRRSRRFARSPSSPRPRRASTSS